VPGSFDVKDHETLSRTLDPWKPYFRMRSTVSGAGDRARCGDSGTRWDPACNKPCKVNLGRLGGLEWKGEPSGAAKELWFAQL
jgi:hypothetical protein